MKIIVLGTRGIPNIQGGVESHCENLFPIIKSWGTDIIVARRTSYVNDENEDSTFKGIVLKDIYAPRYKSIEAIIHTFFGVVFAKFKKVDILHIHAIGPALLVPFARLLGLKVVFTHHGADYDRGKWGRIAKFILKYGEKVGVKYANEVIVISDVIKRSVEEKYKRYDCNLIYNGVEIPSISSSNHYISSLGLESKGYIIGVARFVPEKGFHDLIEAYKLVQTKLKLVLVGDSDHESKYSRELKIRADELGIIRTGFIKGERLNEIFSHAALFALPSYHEGLPIALLEAMSYNLKVLVSDIPANLEVDLGEKSYFKVGDVNDLAKSLLNRINSDDNPDYINVLKRKYNWDSIAKMTIEVYNKLNKHL